MNENNPDLSSLKVKAFRLRHYVNRCGFTDIHNIRVCCPLNDGQDNQLPTPTSQPQQQQQQEVSQPQPPLTIQHFQPQFLPQEQVQEEEEQQQPVQPQTVQESPVEPSGKLHRLYTVVRSNNSKPFELDAAEHFDFVLAQKKKKKKVSLKTV